MVKLKRKYNDKNKYYINRMVVKMKEQEKKKYKFRTVLSIFFKRPIFYVLIGFLIFGGLTIGITTVVSNESKTTKIDFKDIGELATQSAYTCLLYTSIYHKVCFFVL